MADPVPTPVDPPPPTDSDSSGTEQALLVLGAFGVGLAAVYISHKRGYHTRVARYVGPQPRPRPRRRGRR